MRFGFLEFLTLAGSLGLFIYGMKLMSELLTVMNNKQREHLMTRLAKYEQITDRFAKRWATTSSTYRKLWPERSRAPRYRH
jgi:hypothetical protein